jgi:hypothetical protein
MRSTGKRPGRTASQKHARREITARTMPRARPRAGSPIKPGVVRKGRPAARRTG